MTPTKIVLAFAAMFALLFTFAIVRIPAAAEPERAAVAQEQFDAAWDDTMRVTGAEALRKKDQERVVSAETRTVTTERIIPETTPIPPVILVDDDPAPVVRRTRRASASVERHANTQTVASLRADVCTRHHMHRVSTHGGRSWRCRR
jgi:hypothetical protein